MSTTTAVTPERIMQFAWGYVPPMVLESAIHHRVFDVLDEGPKTLKETAALTTDEGDTYSFEEISESLKEAGFVDARLLEAPGPSPLVLATKP
jgi:hypothetical protein